MPFVVLSSRDALLYGAGLCALGAAAAAAALAFHRPRRGTFLLLSDRDVAAALPMRDAIVCNRRAFLDLAAGVAVVPARAVLAIPPAAGHTLFKPAYIPSTSALGLKVVSTRPKNADREVRLPTVPASIIMFSEDTGLLTALLHATYLTALRTAAGSGVATALFAKHNPARRVLTVFGAGMQADAHIEAMLCVHGESLDRLIVVNRSKGRAEAQCAKHRGAFAAGARVVLLSDAKKIEAAVRASDLICTTTNSSAPMFDGAWMKPGTHVNAVGSYTPTAQELDRDTVARCAIVIDSEHALAAGDLAIPTANGEELCVVGELGQVLKSVAEGGEFVGNSSEIVPPPRCDCTLFKSVGVAVQDVATAQAVIEAARKRGIGRQCAM